MQVSIEGVDPQPLGVEGLRWKRERDLYLGLLNLGEETDPEPFLKNALELIASITGASHGYLELFDAEDSDLSWAHAVGFSRDELDQVRQRVSRGIIGEAVASEKPVVTPSALLDPRFRDRASVRRSGIDAVLCAPIGRDPPRGVLYLQAPTAPDVFDAREVEQVACFCRHLAPLTDRLLEQRRASGRSRLNQLRERLGAQAFIGRSAALTRLLEEVAASAPLEVGVLLLGETGTGKSQTARLIHRNSPRSAGPFVELNCAALPEHLVESELFGAAAGAHSTAVRKIEGKVAAAEGGTLLLDEVSDLSLTAQAKLLQLLQTKQYFQLGSSRVRVANVRVIACANVDLERAMAERRFREDLYYRLRVMTIRVPALAERVEDAGMLARHFCEHAQKTHQLPRVELSGAALRAVENSEWPGNIRQLAHAIESATIRAAAERSTQLQLSHLFPEQSVARHEPATFQQETRRFQEQLLRRTLELTDWNVSAAARRLDLTRAHMYNLIKSFGLKR